MLPSFRQFISLPLNQVPFVIFDLETTGGNPENVGITEICAIKYKQNKLQGSFYSLVQPTEPLTPMAKKLTGLHEKMLVDAPLFRDLAKDLFSFFQGHVLVSHNSASDLVFLRHGARNFWKGSFYPLTLCTHLLGEKLWPKAPNKSLEGFADFLELSIPPGHRACQDSLITWQFFLRICQGLESRGIYTLGEAIRFQGQLESMMRVGWKLDEKALEELPNTPGFFVLKDDKGEELLSSSSENLKNFVRRLPQNTNLSKKTLKKVFLASQIELETHKHFFLVMLEEEARGDIPLWWVSPLVMMENTQGHLCWGPWSKAKPCWGPVERSQGQNLLKTFQRALSLGSFFPQSVPLWLENRGAELLSLWKKQRWNWRWFLWPKVRKVWRAQGIFIQELLGHPLKTSLRPLHKTSGTMVIQEGKTGWEFFVKDGQIQSWREKKEDRDWQAWTKPSTRTCLWWSCWGKKKSGFTFKEMDHE